MNSNNIKKNQEIINEIITSEELTHDFRLTKKVITMCVNYVNLRLINIKNQEIEKKFGSIKREKKANNIFFKPSFFIQGN